MKKLCLISLSNQTTQYKLTYWCNYLKAENIEICTQNTSQLDKQKERCLIPLLNQRQLLKQLHKFICTRLQGMYGDQWTILELMSMSLLSTAKTANILFLAVKVYFVVLIEPS